MHIKLPGYSLLICCVLFCTLGSLQAQVGILKGTISDGEGSGTLPGTTIYLQANSGKGVVSDIDGNYTMTGVPVGRQTIVYSFLGFEEQTIEVVITENDVTTQDVALSFASVMGQEVLVTAQALGQAKAINQQLNSESIANIVSADRIQELPDVNAAEAVARLPGVSINRNGGEGQKVVIRGLEPKFNAITVNGVRLPANSGTDRSVDLSLVSPELLDGIEVYKSPLPDMDAEAVGGTVNLRLRKAPKEETTLLRGLVGANNNNDYIGDYKGVVQHSRRILNDKVGVVAQANVERFNRGGDILGYGWSQGSTDPGTGVTSILGTNLRLEDRSEQRRRNNASVNLDYGTGKSEFGFFGLLSNTSRSQFTVENRYAPNGDGITYNATGIDSDLTLYMGALTGTHTLSKYTIDWVASLSRSKADNPYNFNLNILDGQRPFDAGLDRNSNPANFLAAANPDLSTAFLRSSANRMSETTEDNSEFGINVQRSFNLLEGLSGYVKTGVRYRTIERERSVSGRGENFYFLGGRYTQTARDAFNGNLIALEANPELISLANFVEPGDGVDFEDRDGEAVNFDVALNEDLVRNWYDQQRDVLRIDRNTAVDNFGVSESVAAAYLMAKFDIGKKLSVTPGFRYEYSDNSYRAGISSFTDPFIGLAGSFRDTATAQTYGEFMPHLHIKYEPKDWLDVRLSYATTLARPDYSFVSPRTQIDDNALVIDAGNPNLRHMRVVNYDLSISAYKGGLGLFSVGAFYKDIEDIFVPQSLQLVDGLAEERGFPQYNQYLLNTFSNFPTSKVYGFEFDVQTNLSFLPAPFNGLVINANYARLFSETTTFFLTRKNFFVPFPRTEFTSNSRTVTMPSQVPNIINLSIGYDYKSFAARISGVYQGTKATEYGQNKDFDRFVLSYWRWDASVKQKVGDHLSFFLNVNNFTNQKDITFIREEQFVSRVETYGMTGTIGAQYKL
ncbi:TonB-dependent receptor [Neolewinella antarctica]|uniref:TonB-dependent receptor n=1 Tax=Neolewinella antarctica TaxID=442734 RepID=A0ABX0XC97_9BACT|nr:TonB-dependent receptor [Neolewinella antarctica]NJC26889.1 TonB-dependent receptor [Neolewinella antarctica]